MSGRREKRKTAAHALERICDKRRSPEAAGLSLTGQLSPSQEAVATPARAARDARNKTPRNRTSPTMARGIAYALAAVALLCAVLAGAATGDAADDVFYRVGARDLHSQPACLTSTK